MLAPGLRVVFVKPYAIYYTVRRRDVVVVRILHGARNALAQFDDT